MKFNILLVVRPFRRPSIGGALRECRAQSDYARAQRRENQQQTRARANNVVLLSSRARALAHMMGLGGGTATTVWRFNCVYTRVVVLLLLLCVPRRAVDFSLNARICDMRACVCVYVCC